MGWWKVEGTNNLIGDSPLDALGGAVDTVVREYQRAHGRRPTKKEWEALLYTVLGADEPEYRCLDDEVAKGVLLEVVARKV
jgi:hypothetical protein